MLSAKIKNKHSCHNWYQMRMKIKIRHSMAGRYIIKEWAQYIVLLRKTSLVGA